MNGQGNNDKQKFDLLYGSLCEIQKSLLENTAKVAGFLLLATGWIATSSEARAFLATDKVSRDVAVAALVGAFIFFALSAIKAHLASLHTMELLDKLGYVTQEYYVARKVDIRMLVLFVVGNLFLVFLAGLLVLRTGP